MPVKLSDYLVSKLRGYGISHVFLVTGGGAMHLNDSIGSAKGLTYICTQHEQGAAIAAEGFYRACGQMAAVNVTSGPGGTNALTGVIGQWLDSIPCIYVSGQVKQTTTIAFCPELKLRQLGDQEINIADIVRPVTKYSVMVRHPGKIRYHLEKAMYLATHGRPGPVWLDIPLDVQAAMIDEESLTPYSPVEDEIPLDKSQIAAQVSDLLERIRKCERPVIYAGHGIRLAGAQDLFIQLAERLNIPVVTAICGSDLIWEDHPLYFGRPGICGDRLGNFVIQNSDFMLALGARLGIRQIGYAFQLFAREAFRAMVDIDPAELDKPTLNLHMKVRADAKVFIEEMLRQLDGQTLSPKKPWMDWAGQRKKDLPTVLQDNTHRGEYVSPYLFADTLFRSLDAGALVVTGNGTAYTVTYQVMPIKKGVRVFANQGCASMGYDLPAAIGACFARDKQPVVLVTGDGSIQMNIQELHTIVANQLPVKIFMLNNDGYLAIRTTQDAFFKGRHVGSGPEGGLTLPDVGKIAAAYGIPGRRVSGNDDLAANIRQVLEPGRQLCEILMDPAQTLLPKTASVARPDGSIVSRPMEDMYPFLDRKKFRESMWIKPIEE